MRTIHCPQCKVELTIPDEAGSRRLKCPQCATRFYPSASGAPGAKPSMPPKPRGAASDRPQSAAKATPPAPPVPDLRDLVDVPLADEGPPKPVRGRAPAGDAAAALFRDDSDEGYRRKSAAEARQQARICPSCRSVIPAGMSLCEHCNVDVETGERYDVVEELEDEPPPMAMETGAPASIIVIGLLVVIVGGFLALLSMVQFEGIGRICLTAVSLFGVLAGIQFLRGQALKLMIVALMLGGAVDLVVLIIMPIVMAEQVEVTSQDESDNTAAEADPELSRVEKPLAERIDMTKVMLGVGIFVFDAVLLVAVTSPGVRSYFRRSSGDYYD